MVATPGRCCGTTLRSVLPMALIAGIVASVPGSHIEMNTTAGGSRGASGVLTKTAISSKLRLVYNVGLEGSGHHYLEEVFEHMFPEHDGLLLRIRNPISMRSFMVSKSMTEKSSKDFEREDGATTEMRMLAEQATTLPAPGTIAKTKGRLSYPTRNGAGKVFRYLDIRMIAEKAEEEGIDFRVVYLQRSAREMVIASTVHRHFQNKLGDEGEPTPEESFMNYMQILFTDAGAMHSLLTEIDPAFVICHRYSHLGDAEQAGKIAEFLSPTAEVADMLRESLTDTVWDHPAANDSLPFEGSERIVHRLQLKLDVLESTFCVQ